MHVRLALIVAFLVASPAFADELAPRREEKSQLSLRSTYLTDPVGEGRLVRLVGTLSGDAQLTLDGNICTMNRFGDVVGCTEKYYRPYSVRLIRLPVPDPRDQDRHLYRIEGEIQPKYFELLLVVPADREGGYRLVVIDHSRADGNVRAIELKPDNDKPTGDEPKLCKHVTYKARQSGDRVMLTAQGEHPTAGWKSTFEPLPLDIHPIQYRLVCSQLSGTAAQVITPFETGVTIIADRHVQHVIVRDGDGTHRVRVEQTDE
jgi:hypothetical protein